MIYSYALPAGQQSLSSVYVSWSLLGGAQDTQQTLQFGVFMLSSEKNLSLLPFWASVSRFELTARREDPTDFL